MLAACARPGDAEARAPPAHAPAPAAARLAAAMASAVHRLTEEKECDPCLREGQGEAARARSKMWGVARRVPLDLLMAVWGMGTWLGVNGLYMQLPLLVRRLPEGWRLPASMALAVQLANVGLLLLAVLKRLRPRAKDAQYIYALLLVGALALLLNALLFERTAPVGNQQRSVAFLALTFCVALVGCTSSVLFYPYLRHFRDVYLATYLVGEGLSGFVPSLLALVQGVGGEPECVGAQAVDPEPRFGVMVFLLVLTALAIASLFSFTCIDRCETFRDERVAPAAAAKDEEATARRLPLLSGRWLAALALLAVLSALANGVLPSVQSYSCMPYGAQAYHLAITLSAMANPTACLAGVWLRPLAPRALAAALTLALAPLGYILATALLSPAPPLQGQPAGVALVVVCWVVTVAVVSYARMWVYGWARAGGARGMRAAGGVTQLGSAVGSAVLFALVNYTALFTDYKPCAAAARAAAAAANATLAPL